MPSQNELLAEFNALLQSHPDVVKAAIEANPDIAKPVFLWLREEELVEKCHELSPEGYAA